MNTLLKTLWLSITIALAATVSAQNNEYIVKSVKGSVEYKLKSSDDWQPVKRLLSLPKASTLNIAAGAELTVYSQSNPQPLRISKQGESRLRTLIAEAEKSATVSRGKEIISVFNSKGNKGITMRSGTSFRGNEDQEFLLPLSKAVKSPAASGNTPISLTLIKDGEGDFDVEISNNSADNLAAAIIINVGGKYSALHISGDASNPGMLDLPAGMKLMIPDCKIVDIEGMKVVALASKEVFNPETLCTLMNGSNIQSENENGSDAGAVAVEALIR
ncbi:MAG: hypothetical protein K2M11_00585 [Paramuribaculum sp.]|nr:hypothetical protein [Paramuribaculum sp.]